nr:E3 ubiquitin-protein ligase UPL1-like [Tanacetum cinerariifolium]
MDSHTHTYIHYGIWTFTLSYKVFIRLSDKVYLLTGEVLNKLASVASSHRKFFIVELSDLTHSLSESAISELITLRNTQILGLSSGSMAGAAVLRILQTLSSLTLPDIDDKGAKNNDDQEHVTMWKLNLSLEPLWQELSECISVTESQLAHGSLSSVMSNANTSEHVQGTGASSPPLPPGTQRLLSFIEAFLVLCEKLQATNSILQRDDAYAKATEVKELSGSSSTSGAAVGGAVTFSRIKQQHDQHLTGPLRISVRRAYVLEDSYNQLRMRPTQDLKGRLNVHFQGEEGIDAGGLTREWYQLLSRVIFDKGALLFTTGGNNATFQPNPNSVYHTEHLSYFKFVAKALFDGQLLDVYFAQSFYKHILGVKVTYHDIYGFLIRLFPLYQNDASDILELTFSMDADEEKQILYEKSEVADHELKPGGRNTRVTEETKHEYVDLVAEHILTNAIRPQINSFLEGLNELIPRGLISIFNDKELELLISGLPEIDFDDLKVNTEYTGYTVGTKVVIWFGEVVKAFNKEDRARLLQFVTGTSEIPLEGFKALQGISGPQRFQIHKAYGTPERLPSAHT